MALLRAACLSPLPLSLLFLLLPFFALHHAPLSSAADTISANNSLSGSQTITSASGTFVLGFFKPGNSSGNYYVGIWYSISNVTRVWVANRENPVADPSMSELRISDDGNLVLLDQSEAIIWTTNTSVSSNSTVAVILDSGNLQLRDASNESHVFWQSFDHPTDTWLPGGKLGLNKVTNQTQHLTAWKNSADPAPGIFSLELDPNGTSQYFTLWNMTTRYWTSGIWNDKIFSNVPEMTSNYIYDFQYVSDEKENYFTYTVNDDKIITRFVMDVSGQIKQSTWLFSTQSWLYFWSQPRQQCQVYALCGAFGRCNEIITPFCNCVTGFSPKSQSDWNLGDQSGGCVRDTPLACQSSSPNSEKDKFLKMTNMRLPVNSQNLSGVGSEEACEVGCLSDCSCTAYSYNSSGCSVWYGDLMDLQEQFNGSDASILYLRLAASELPSSSSSKGTITWIAVGVTVAVLACVAIVWFITWRRRSRRMTRVSRAVGGALVPFRYGELQHATKNFSHKLGEGGFGSVFKGWLPDSTVIAVKKLEGLRQGEKQFRTEVSTIGTIQHVNLVRLLGFCSEGDKKLLVYEFMPKGSLDTLLFEPTPTALDWKTRYQIAVGTARGLAYLHEQCRDCIIHCDIKPENILLDESFVPKVADFGLAKLVGRDFSRVLTTMRGTRGYLAPEWIAGVAITAKADVYSYGMMLLEIISGRRNLTGPEEGSHGFFPALVAGKLVDGEVESLLDYGLGGEAESEEVERACRLACWCIQNDELSRPTMGQVVQVLEGFLEVNVPPIPRSLQLLADETPDHNINFYFDSQTRSATSNSSQVKSTTSNSSGA
ncbi:G-type lectin S-receptor-like serine/threonine-protein kinase At2g19130 [Musa acuminata AAA Group]|uniref:G-type lectin S-receptor-like serine/threonine-protein kinase At2g19130 n=1 Tax=Musa acuminata AAA Group TaxID=214697 RepID=UPI0031D946C6